MRTQILISHNSISSWPVQIKKKFNEHWLEAYEKQRVLTFKLAKAKKLANQRGKCVTLFIIQRDLLIKCVETKRVIIVFSFKFMYTRFR